jgi:hypothetical protein
LYWWETASPAEKVIFKEFVFTRLSQNGLPIWSDCCIEWTMGHIQEFMGKHHHLGHEAKLHRIVPEIPWRKNQSDPMRWRSIFRDLDILEEDAMSNIACNWNNETLWREGIPKIYALYYSQI